MSGREETEPSRSSPPGKESDAGELNVVKKAQTPLLMEQLIGAPIAAVVEAQQHSARATLEFIEKMIEPPSSTSSSNSSGGREGKRMLKRLDFSYETMDSGPDGRGVIRSQTLSIPLVTLVPIPFVNINEAEINFSAKIVYHEEAEGSSSSSSSSSSSNRGSQKYPSLPKFMATYASSSKRRSSDFLTSHLDVKIKLKQQIPEGLAKSLSILSNSITVKSDDEDQDGGRKRGTSQEAQKEQQRPPSAEISPPSSPPTALQQRYEEGKKEGQKQHLQADKGKHKDKELAGDNSGGSGSSTPADKK